MELRESGDSGRRGVALVLGRFLGEKAPHVSLIIHRDQDYLSTGAGNAFVNRLNQAGVGPFLTEHNDIEGYFLSADHLHALNPTVTVERVQQLIDQATAETADRSVTAIINQRTAEAFRERREGGAPPNHGKIGVQAQVDYGADPGRLRRGKEVLGRLHALIQQELGANPRIFLPPHHLRCEALRGLVASIWPAQ